MGLLRRISTCASDSKGRADHRSIDHSAGQPVYIYYILALITDKEKTHIAAENCLPIQALGLRLAPEARQDRGKPY